MAQVTRRELFQLASSITPALWFARGAFAQTAPTLELHPLSEKLTLLTGAGGNIAILQGEDGLLLIDSGLPATAEAMDSKARSVGPSSIKVLFNTHFHFDHVGGNERLGREGVRIIAHENVLKRLSTPQKNAFLNRESPALALEGRPVVTFSSGGELKHGGEKLVYKYLPPAHTDGDSTVHFQNANVYHAGDLLFNGMYPFIDYSAGGAIEGMVAAADRIVEAVDEKTKIIPGHGPMAVRSDVRTWRDMLAGVNEKVTGLFNAGRTLEQAQAAEPTKPWDEKWGNGFLKGADFVRMLYAGKSGGHA
jgi:cyclase